MTVQVSITIYWFLSLCHAKRLKLQGKYETTIFILYLVFLLVPIVPMRKCASWYNEYTESLSIISLLMSLSVSTVCVIYYGFLVFWNIFYPNIEIKFMNFFYVGNWKNLEILELEICSNLLHFGSF